MEAKRRVNAGAWGGGGVFRENRNDARCGFASGGASRILWCVRLALRLAALVVCCSGLSFWLGGGLHMGWSKSTETRTEIDEVTGLEYPVTVSKYVFGVELLGAALGVSGGLFGLSFAFCKPA